VKTVAYVVRWSVVGGMVNAYAYDRTHGDWRYWLISVALFVAVIAPFYTRGSSS
jgi:hypothetical protein